MFYVLFRHQYPFFFFFFFFGGGGGGEGSDSSMKCPDVCVGGMKTDSL